MVDLEIHFKAKINHIKETWYFDSFMSSLFSSRYISTNHVNFFLLIMMTWSHLNVTFLLFRRLLFVLKINSNNIGERFEPKSHFKRLSLIVRVNVSIIIIIINNNNVTCSCEWIKRKPEKRCFPLWFQVLNEKQEHFSLEHFPFHLVCSFSNQKYESTTMFSSCLPVAGCGTFLPSFHIQVI